MMLLSISRMTNAAMATPRPKNTKAASILSCLDVSNSKRSTLQQHSSA